MRQLYSPTFPLKVISDFLDRRRRALDAAEAAGVVLPPSVYDAALQGIDSRVQNPSKRGTWWHRKWGLMSRMYCASCGKQSPYAVSESMIATVYLCNDCATKKGPPPGMKKVAESAW